jgi:hypothetical protein
MTGLVTTASLVPWLGPGQLLTSLSERWPRRRIMVVADLERGYLRRSEAEGMDGLRPPGGPALPEVGW